MDDELKGLWMRIKKLELENLLMRLDNLGVSWAINPAAPHTGIRVNGKLSEDFERAVRNYEVVIDIDTWKNILIPNEKFMVSADLIHTQKLLNKGTTQNFYYSSIEVEDEDMLCSVVDRLSKEEGGFPKNMEIIPYWEDDAINPEWDRFCECLMQLLGGDIE